MNARLFPRYPRNGVMGVIPGVEAARQGYFALATQRGRWRTQGSNGPRDQRAGVTAGSRSN